MVHNVFQGHLEVSEHVFDIIFMFHHVFQFWLCMTRKMSEGRQNGSFSLILGRFGAFLAIFGHFLAQKPSILTRIVIFWWFLVKKSHFWPKNGHFWPKMAYFSLKLMIFMDMADIGHHGRSCTYFNQKTANFPKNDTKNDKNMIFYTIFDIFDRFSA